MLRVRVASARDICSWDALFWSHGRSLPPLPFRPPGAPAWPLGPVVSGLVWSRASGAGRVFGDCLGEESGRRDGVGPGAETGFHCLPVTGLLGLPPQLWPPLLGRASHLVASSRMAALPCSLPSRCPRRPADPLLALPGAGSHRPVLLLPRPPWRPRGHLSLPALTSEHSPFLPGLPPTLLPLPGPWGLVLCPLCLGAQSLSQACSVALVGLSPVPEDRTCAHPLGGPGSPWPELLVGPGFQCQFRHVQNFVTPSSVCLLLSLCSVAGPWVGISIASVFLSPFPGRP